MDEPETARAMDIATNIDVDIDKNTDVDIDITT